MTKTKKKSFSVYNDSQTDGMIMDNYGMLYFGLLRNHAICKWDSYRPFTLENQIVVAKDDTHIQWTDGNSFNSIKDFHFKT